MMLATRYNAASSVVAGMHGAQVSLATNTLREATYFRGVLGRPLVFREAMAALHGVVLSDFKYRPRDRVAFRAWLEEQDRKFLASLKMRSEKARQDLEGVEARLGALDAERRKRLQPFYRARDAYLNHVYEHEYEINYLYDPVITVHPDQVFFEAFSKDESSYARLGAKYDVFDKVHEFACGTTNIDFSVRLAGELERIRTYRRTEFDIAPGGLTVTTEGAAHKEKKIDLPESWVQGFLQVQSTMAMGLTRLELATVDLFNIIRFLRRHQAKASPRALRYELTPGEKVKVVFEPWEHVMELHASPRFEGPKKLSVRTWGRDRLKTLGRLLPVAQKVHVHLAGFGLPSIYVVDLGEVDFTLALSGWTDNDWTGGARFDLLTRRLEANAGDLLQVYEALRNVRASTDTALATSTGMGVEKTRSVLSHLCQVGRAIFDLSHGVYRHRDLFFDPFTMKEAQAAVKPAVVEATKEAKQARAILHADNVRIIARRPVSTGFKLSGSAKGEDGTRVRPLLHVDKEGQIIEASCSCAFFKKHALTKGPCQHVLALRLAHMARLEEEDGKGGGLKM